MASDSEGDDSTRLAPDEAFAVLGNATRMEVLQVLSDAGEPLRFSELHDRVGMRDSGQFNYHLEKLVGHFVNDTEEGYELTQTGSRVIEAVLTGAVTATPEMELTAIDQSCHLCGAGVKAHYIRERVELFCTECNGTYGKSSRQDEGRVPESLGYLGGLPLPPAGVVGRSPDVVFRAAWIWGNLEILSIASRVCPRCSALLERTPEACDDHDSSDGPCETCDRRFAVYIDVECTNCNFGVGGGIVLAVAAHTSMLAFLTAHDVNPIAPDSIARISRVHENYDEELLSTDPLEAHFTFHLDDDSLVLAVDEDLSVVEVEDGAG